MISKWLSETFNPPAWNSNVLKAGVSKNNYTYKTTSIIFGLVASAGIIGGAFAYTLAEPEQAAQVRDDAIQSVVERFTADAPKQDMSPD